MWQTDSCCKQFARSCNTTTGHCAKIASELILETWAQHASCSAGEFNQSVSSYLREPCSRLHCYSLTLLWTLWTSSTPTVVEKELLWFCVKSLQFLYVNVINHLCWVPLAVWVFYNIIFIHLIIFKQICVRVVCVRLYDLPINVDANKR